MTRLSTMSRFEEDDSKPVTECGYCSLDVYPGTEVWEKDGEIFCSSDCVAKNEGAVQGYCTKKQFYV